MPKKKYTPEELAQALADSCKYGICPVNGDECPLDVFDCPDAIKEHWLQAFGLKKESEND